MQRSYYTIRYPKVRERVLWYGTEHFCDLEPTMKTTVMKTIQRFYVSLMCVYIIVTETNLNAWSWYITDHSWIVV